MDSPQGHDVMPVEIRHAHGDATTGKSVSLRKGVRFAGHLGAVVCCLGADHSGRATDCQVLYDDGWQP
jgi:hypothetical protein